MNLLIPAAAAAALAAAALLQGEEAPYRWTTGEMGCAAMLDGPGPDGVGPITALVESGMRDEPYLALSAWSEAWPLSRDEQYALDIGLDGAPPELHVAEAGSHQDGTISFELEPELRARLRGVRSLDLYRDGQRFASVPAVGLAEALDGIDGCAFADADVTENSVSMDDMLIETNSLTPEEMSALEAAERALDAAAADLEGKPD